MVPYPKTHKTFFHTVLKKFKFGFHVDILSHTKFIYSYLSIRLTLSLLRF